MRRFYLSFLLLFLGISSGLLAGNFNFPQNKDYPFGNRVSSSSAASEIQSIYNSWKSSFYVEGTKGGVSMARIKFTDCSHSSCNGEHTVSEGIGYGMLIFVYMDNATNQTQDEFNKLWAYYKAFDNNSNGLMEWETTGFDGVYKQGAATDGDLDVALALLLADKQWGSSGTVDYVTEAKKLLNNIFNLEVNGDFLKPGDAWDNVKNPCYFTLAAFRLFDKAQTLYGYAGSDNHNWKAVLEKSYSYLGTVQGKSSAGLYPDWSTASGDNPYSNDWKYEYGMDACRTPWRVVWDYLWYGAYASTNNALTLSTKTANWVSTNASVATSTGDKYNLDGTKTGSWNNAAYMGGFGCALMCDAKYSNLLTSYYNATRDFSTTEYYQKTLQILYMLMMTGNCTNFFDGSPVAGRISGATIPEAGTTIDLTFSKAMNTISSSNASLFSVKINGTAGTIASLVPNASDKTKASLTFATPFKSSDVVTLTYNGTAILDADNLALPKVTDYPVNNAVPASGLLISDCNDTIVVTGGPWYSYNDGNVKGASVVTPLSAKNIPFVMTDPGYKGAGDKCAKVEYTLDKGTFEYDPFIGLGFKILKDSTAVGTDWSTATGIEFYHKGDACVISPFMSNFMDSKTPTKVSDNQWYADIPKHTDWTLVKITFDQQSTTNTTGLKLPSWFSVAQIAAAPAIDPTKFFKVQWQIQGATGTTGTMSLDELTIAGIKAKTADKAALEAAIAAAKVVLDAAVTGEGDGQYPLAAYNTLSTAKSTASNVNADAKATQAAVDAQVTALNAAVTAFKATKITVTKTALKASIDLAADAKTAAVVGEGNGQYRQASLDSLTTAIAAAKDVYDAAGSSQVAVNTAKTDIDDALALFQGRAIVVKKTKLAAAVTDATAAANAATPGSAVGNYPQTTIDAYNAAIKLASDVNKDASATQAAVDKAVADLATATTTFNNAKVTAVAVDTKPLTDAISAANAVKTAAVVGAGNGQYAQTSVNTLASAITTAEGIVTTATTQAQITAAVTALEDAVKTFQASAIVVTKSDLNDSISSANTFVGAVKIGSGNGQYPQPAVDAYNTAIDAANTVYKDADASQTDVDNAVETLAAATVTFKKAKIVVDFTALKAKIDEVTTLVGSVSFGAGNGQYPTSAKTDLLAAQSAANTVYTNTTATATQVSAAISDLTTAITTFKGTKIVVDYSQLNASLDAADKVYSGASIGNGDGQYTSTDAATLKAAIDNAVAVSKNTTATAAEVAAAKTAVDDAVAAFTPKKISVDLTALNTAISSANALKTAAVVGTADGEYTQAVVNDFGTAITAATDVTKITHVTKAAVDQAVIDLNAAIDLFKKSANTSAATDFSELSATISTAKATYTGLTFGTEACEYPTDAKTTFDAVISASEAMVTTGTAKQGEVNSQITTLKSAKTTFLSKVNPEASKTALLDSISKANSTYVGKTIGSNPNQYPKTDSIALRNAINAAIAVSENKCATVAQITAQKAAISKAIADFLASKVKEASKTDLAAAIATGDEKAATPSAQIGTNPGQYAQDKFATMTAALAAAKIVYANSSATSTEVLKATQDLTNAITAFNNSYIALVDKAALNAIIVKTKAFLDSTTAKIGSNPGQYPSVVVSALQSKYSSAKVVNETAASTKEAVDAAKEALVTVYDIAVASRVAPIDKSELATEIVTAQNKVPSASQIGTAVGQYSTTVVANLNAAIAAANTVKSNLLATTKEVATALANLKAAETALVVNTSTGGGGDPVVTLSKTQLINDSIVASNLLKAQRGSLPTEYNATLAQVTALKSSLSDARDALSGTSQTYIDATDVALQDAIRAFTATLVPSPSKSVLNTLIANVDAALITSPDRHPSDLTEALTEALAAAKVVAANKKATESEISSAVAALSAANNNWKASVVDAKALKDAILAATILKIDISKNIGTVPTTYLKADFDAFVNAIVAAQAAYDDASASQSVIDAAHLALTSAQKSIKPIESANKASLEYKISEANRKLNGAVAGTKPGNYKIAEYDTLVNRLERATVILSNAKATQAQVDKIKSELNKAIVEFENAQIPATDVAEVDGITVTAATVVENALVIRATGGEIVSVKIIGVWGCDAPAISVNASEATINVSDLSSQIYRAQCVLSNGKVETINFVK